MFLRHEGYLGAIGAFLKGAEEDGNDLLYFMSSSFVCLLAGLVLFLL